MKKFFIRMGILLLIFVGTVAGTAVLLNSESTDDRSDMNPSSLPEVMMSVDDVLVNRMCGYKQKMQVDFARDSLTPMDASKTLNIVVNPYENKVQSVSYEIRTSDGSKVVENKKLKNLTDVNGYLRATVQIEKPMLMNQEYSLQIQVTTEKEDYYYYTRVIQRSNVYTGEYLNFAKNFYECCIDKGLAESLVNYLEPDTSNTEVNYSRVSITSPWSVISWGTLQPQISRTAVPTIKDINEITGSIVMEYQITALNENGGIEWYDVTDFYRMSYSQDTITLLDFERSAQQIFSSESAVTAGGIVLGVRDRDVTYMTDTDTQVAAFVQQGDLWTYSPQSDKLVKVFTFRQDKNGDFRDSRNDHDLKIIRVDENGDVDFVLYGYMNRGIHEGYAGVSVCHYHADQNVVEEKVFIPSTQSYEFLKENMGTLSYVNKDNELFLLLGGKLYEINIQEQTYEILAEGISQEGFFVSDTNAHAAWMVTGENGSACIREIDFDTKETRDLVPADGQQVRVLGFFNEDMVYGIAVQENILADARGNEIFAMSSLRIEDFQGNVKKEYQPEGMVVTGVTIGSAMMEMQLCQRNGDSYTVVKTDNIMNNRKAVAKQMDVELIDQARRGTLVRLAFEENLDEEVPLQSSAKMRFVDSKEVVLDTQVPEEEVYYVYARGHLEGIYRDPAAAIRQADSLTGVVLNRAQQYVWERGNLKTQIQLNTEDVPAKILEGSLDVNTIQESMGDSGVVIDLTGCTLDSILYQVSARRAVAVKTGADEVKVIVGYDPYNTWLYDPKKGETSAYAMDDSEKLFEKNGNVYVTYIEKLK